MRVLKLLFILTNIFLLEAQNNNNSLKAQNYIYGEINAHEWMDKIPKILVEVKGSNAKVLSDSKGLYKIKAKKGDLLMFSHKAYEDRYIFIGDKEEINVLMHMKKAEIVYSNQSNHLVPLRSILDSDNYKIGYNLFLKKILFKEAFDYPDIQLLSQPSFNPENLLQIKKEKVLFFKPKNSIWSFFYRKKNDIPVWKQNYLDSIKVQKYSCNISKKSNKLIKKLYNVSIEKTRYRFFTEEEMKMQYTFGNDGETYTFSVANIGVKSGKIWSPKKENRMGRLVAINKELTRLVVNSNRNDTIEFSNLYTNKIKKLIDDIILSNEKEEKSFIKKIKDTIVNHLNKHLDINEKAYNRRRAYESNFIYKIRNGKIKTLKVQSDYNKTNENFLDWWDNLFYRKTTPIKMYKKALKNLDLSYLNLELNLKVYIDLEYNFRKEKLIIILDY